MLTRKTKMFFIGAAFIAAPIITAAQSPARAVDLGGRSNGNVSVQLLQEIRNLQQEIAELRNRVDQQEYEMRKLKAQPNGSANASGSVSSNYNTNVAQGSVQRTEQYPVNSDYQAQSNGYSSPEVVNEGRQPITNETNYQDQANGQVIVEERDLSGAVPVGQAPSGPVPVASIPVGEVAQQSSSAIEQQPIQTQRPIQQPSGNDSGLRSEDRVQSDGWSAPANNGARVQTEPRRPASQQGRLLESGDRAIRTDLQEQDLYAKGLEKLKKQQYQEAVSVFNSQLQAYPRGQRSADAYYWVGESLYILGNLDSAKKSYSSILSLFSTSRRAPSALLKIGVIEQEMGNEALAQSTLQSLVARYPDSAAAIQAKSRFPDLL